MADAWDETNVTDIEICPDGRLHIFGASPQIMSLLQSMGWDDDRVRRRSERLRRSVAEFRQQQERAS